MTAKECKKVVELCKGISSNMIAIQSYRRNLYTAAGMVAQALMNRRNMGGDLPPGFVSWKREVQYYGDGIKAAKKSIQTQQREISKLCPPPFNKQSNTPGK